MNINKEVLLNLATAQSTFIKGLLANIVFLVACVHTSKQEKPLNIHSVTGEN